MEDATPRTKPAAARTSVNIRNCGHPDREAQGPHPESEAHQTRTSTHIIFICAKCLKVCHSLDDGPIEDDNNQNNQCGKVRTRRIAAPDQ